MICDKGNYGPKRSLLRAQPRSAVFIYLSAVVRPGLVRRMNIAMAQQLRNVISTDNHISHRSLAASGHVRDRNACALG